MLYIDSYTGQPGSTAVTGNHTDFADRSVYRGQILVAISNPQTTTLLVGVAALGLALGSRRRC